MVKRFLNLFKDKHFLLILLAIIIPITSVVLTYGVLRDDSTDNATKGVSGDTVYVNDYDSDYYYYTGQNYTSNSGSLPTTSDKEIYNDSNLVKVTVTYNGTDYSNKNTGYVSLDEKQSKYVYYKYFPVNDGYITIDLIDNPFSNHPNDLMFNGWVTDYKGASVSLDNTYYERSAKVPVTYSNGKPNEINITFYASWTEGKVAYVSSNFNSASSSLDSAGMHKISTVTYIYDTSVEGYYTSDTITTTTVVSGRGWNQTRDTTYGTCEDCYDSYNDYHDSYQCPAPSNTWGTGTFTNTCTVYYKQTSSDKYDPSKTYYTYSGYGYSEVTLNPTIIGTKEDGNFNSNSNMAGYYRKTTVDFNSSLDGYYDSDGNGTSGTCYTWGGCEEYELIQFYKEDGSEELLDPDTDYYYLTTRDTNMVVMTGNTSSSWSSSFTKPFTLTGIYNGKDYSPTWTVSSTSVTAYTSLSIENLTINSRSSKSNYNPPTSSGTSGVFYGNYNNVKIGRGIKQSGNYVNFRAIVGGYSSSSGYGSSTVGSSSSPKKYKLIVESGYYSSATSTLGAQTGTNGTSLYTEMYTVYGNDYDRVTSNNSNLDLYYCASGSWSGQIHSSNDTNVSALNTIVKSGSFGSGKYDFSTGIYVGGRYGGTQYTPKTIKVEGGYIYNLIGGPVTSSNLSGNNAVYIYMTGGSVDVITGGAGRSETYGNRVVQVTGGTVNYGVSGGSNGYTGSSSEGVLSGSTYVYIGGTSTIGDDDLITSDSNLYGISSGTVFGAGNGNSSYASIGSVNNSYIVINDKANIKGNVYGSGNYGTVGYNSGGTVVTEIDVLGGTTKAIFGSGNNSGSGKEYSTTMDVTINMTGGEVTDGIYGGSNQSGTLYGDVTLNITGGSVNNVFGGGLGSDTYVAQNVLVNLGDKNNTLNLTGSAYGGSAYGTVNGKEKSTSKSSYTTLVNVNGGTINNVFGGGKGDSSNTPYVLGDVTLTINDGVVNNAFGGNDAAGEANGTVLVYLKGGEVTNAYGGGNKTKVTNTYVYEEGSTVGNLFGGSNESGNVTSSNISVTSGSVTSLYGGNNVGGKTTTTNISMTSGSVTTMYGGGKLTDTGTSNISVTSGILDTIYGGGEKASISDSTNIDVRGGTINTIYGGSNINGDVPISNVSINGGTITSIYGGNNAGGVTTTTNIDLNKGAITTIYGGGNKTSTTTSNVKLNGANTISIYGGGNEAGVTTTNIDLITGNSDSVYGGSNSSGEVTTSNITSTNPSNLSVNTIYGGNNAGGNTGKAYVTLSGGTFNNIYGGGNKATTDYTYVDVNNITMNGKFYGGGNEASINYNTSVKFKNSSITGDLFGGGNLGSVLGNTSVYISNSTIKSSAYAGGNGSSATVLGNTTLTIDGTSKISKHVFGGGNAANTGSKDSNNSVSTVNIAGATISGNVYGGANTAKLYGKVILNIGHDVSDYIKSGITISGTVFGGGEANASGSANYDYSFISVTKGITINIDGDDYSTFDIAGSIFGSGNASSTEGYSYVNISNYGTFNNYKKNISLQRADTVTIKNSAIYLKGTTDRTNEYSDTLFSISRVGELKLANDSTLFLETGTNLLEKFSSLLISDSKEEKAKVTISDTVTKNVNNRVYTLEGVNLNIATNESVTSYGKVSGMTFFGMFTLDRNNNVNTAFYDNKYDMGDNVSSGEFYTFTSGSYVLGAHNSNHDIEVDGFYSNYENEDDGTVLVKYIEPTPSDASYYMWVIGEGVTTYELSLTASKYSTLGTYELPLTASSSANTTFEIIGFNYQDLEDGFELVDPDSISKVNTEGSADSKMALSMESSNTGFVTKGKTNFLTSDSSISGTRGYVTENSSTVPSLLFYLYHSKNITQKKTIGTVIISLLAIKPIDDLNSEVTRINIKVNLSSALFGDNDYEGAMTAGEEYSLFASTATNITTKSNLSAYYSLYMESSKKYYQDGYYHALVSDYVFPLNTKLTMIDLVTNRYYYYVIDSDDVTKATNEYNLYGECSYDFASFVAMGSTSSDNNFDESVNNDNYYKSGYVDEEFIINVSFEDTSISGNQTGKLLLELRNKDNQVLNSVLSIQHSSLTYNLYDGSSATIDMTGDLSNSNIYLGDKPNLDLTLNFTQPIINSLPVTDTTYFDKKMGVKISIYDKDGNKLNNSSLLGLTYEYDGNCYYPRMDGSVRIRLADKVANLYSKIKVNTENLNLSSGNYTMKIESFGSSDGIYYGPESSSSLSIPFTIVDSVYGLNVTLPNDEVIISKVTGYTSKNNNSLDFSTGYSSNLENPSIRVKLYRRTYNNIYDTSYELVDLASYVTNSLDKINDKEYMFISDPNSDSTKSLYLRSTLRSGTYKFVFSLYDKDTFIGDSSTYIIVK